MTAIFAAAYKIAEPYMVWIVFIFLLILALVLGAVWFDHEGKMRAEADQMKKDIAAYQADAAKSAAIGKKLEDDLTSSRFEAQQLNERLNDEIAKNGVYRACHVPPSGVQLLKRALAGQPAS